MILMGNAMLMKCEISLLTILIPVYNTRDYLNQCLRSLDMQTNSNFNVIIIDDGSTDGSGQICDEWARRRDRVKVIHRENCGLFETRKQAIRLTETEYFLCLDSDDELFPTAVECIVREIRSLHPDVVDIGRTVSAIDIENNIIGTISPGYYGLDEMAYIKREVCSGKNNCLPGRAIKTELYRGIVWQNPDLRLTMAEDWIQNIAIVDVVESYSVLPHAGYYYRQVESSSTHKYSRKYVLDSILAYRTIRIIITDWGAEYLQRVDNAELMLLFGYYQVMQNEYDRDAYFDEVDWLASILVEAGIVTISPMGMVQKIRLLVMKLNANKKYWAARMLSSIYLGLRKMADKN